MPYIVTTTTPHVVDTIYPGEPWPTLRSRVAVATLDEARDLAVTVVGDRRAADPTETIDTLELASPRWDDRCTDAQRLPAEGGTVGPLPDGTTIAVDPAGWDRLRDESGWRRAAVVAFNADNRHEVCAAWNREHGGTA